MKCVIKLRLNCKEAAINIISMKPVVIKNVSKMQGFIDKCHKKGVVLPDIHPFLNNVTTILTSKSFTTGTSLCNPILTKVKNKGAS